MGVALSKPSERHWVIGGLLFFALWLFVALPFLYGVPRYSHDEAANKCSSEESKNHGFWEKAACDPTAYFTLWLVAFTGVLAVSTIGLGIATLGLYKTGEKQIRLNAENAAAQSRDMQESIAVTRISAESSVVAAHAASQSAHVAEQTLLASERPYVLLEVVNTANLGFAIRSYPSMTVKFVNHGNSPALMKVCFIELLDDPPPNPTIAPSKLPTIYHIIGAGGHMDPVEVPVANVPPNQVWTGDNAKRLVLHGYLKYGDILEAMHTQHIYLRAGKDAATWTEEGGTAYNYRHTQLPYEVEIKVG